MVNVEVLDMFEAFLRYLKIYITIGFERKICT